MAGGAETARDARASGVERTAARPPAEPGTSVAGVSCRYDDVPVLDRLDLTVPEGGTLGVIGPSGSGKSTLLNLIAGLREADEGEVTVFGRTGAADRLARCALMPQADLLLPWRTALDNAGLGLENRGLSRREARERVRPLFQRFGLGGFERRWPHQLSGGMRQRVSFLRTLVTGKQVLLLDEPFGGLDQLTRADMQDWLREAPGQEPRTTVLVTHDVEEALLMSREVVVLSPRPARVTSRVPVELPTAPSRRELVAMPEFVALRGQVLAALEAG